MYIYIYILFFGFFSTKLKKIIIAYIIRSLYFCKNY